MTFFEMFHKIIGGVLFIKFIKNIYFIIVIFSVIIIIFFSPILSQYTNSDTPNNSITQISSSNISDDKFFWPLLEYTRISSYFGKRTSPTAFASSNHKGIDIPAPAGTNIYAAMSGTVVTAKFSGSGGCTVTVKNGDIYTSYCHVSPNYLVSPGLYVEKGQLIAQVGPKNVYGISENKYRDNNGNPTNGATTGPHLHFAVRKNSTYLNPLDFF